MASRADTTVAGISLIVNGASQFFDITERANNQMARMAAASAKAAARINAAMSSISSRMGTLNSSIGLTEERIRQTNVAFNMQATRLAQAKQKVDRYNASYKSVGELAQKIADLETKSAATSSAAWKTRFQNQANALKPILKTYKTLDPIVARLEAGQQRLGNRMMHLVHVLGTKRTALHQLATAYQDLQNRLAGLGPRVDTTAQKIKKAASTISQALGAIGSIKKGIGALGQAGVPGMAGLFTLLGGNEKFGDALKNALGGAGNAARQVGSEFKSAGFATIFFANLLASLTRDVIRLAAELGGKLLRALGSVAKLGWQATASNEALALTVQSMVASNMQNEDATLGYEEALQAAIPATQALVNWTEKLGILSPFSSDDVKQIFQFALSLSFTEKQAQRVTQAIVNWASATGRTMDQMERATYALGQIATAGRLVGQDIQQLAQVGIGVDEILARAFHKSMPEIREMREQNLIPTAEALELVMTELEKLGNSAERQAFSVRGLASTIMDIAKISSRNFFGPMNMQTLQVGGAIGVLQKRLKGFMGFFTSDFLQGLLRDAGKGFGKLVDNAFTWGQNFVTNIANGMMAGVASIVRALTHIGQMITFWLKPGSPPRLLPDLDKWGAAAISAFFEGMTGVQIGSFDSIAGQVEQMIRSSFFGDEDSKGGMFEQIFGARTGIADAVAEVIKAGKVTDEVLAKVFSSLGSVTPATKAYVQAMLELAVQNEKVIKAQDELNKVTKYYDDLLKPIEDKLTDLNDAQADIVDANRAEMLALVLADPNASASEKELARLEIEKMGKQIEQRAVKKEARVAIDAAQAVLDAETEKLRLIQLQVDAAKALMDVQIDQNRLLQEYMAFLQALEDKKKAGGGEGATPMDMSGAFAGLSDEFELTLPDLGLLLRNKLFKLRQEWDLALWFLKSSWRRAWEDIERKLKPFFDAADRVKAAVDNLKDKFAEKMPLIEEAIAKIIAFATNKTADEGTSVLDLITDMINTIARIVDKHGEHIIQFLTVLVIVSIQVFVWIALLIAQFLAFSLRVGEALLDANAKITQFLTDVGVFFDDLKAKWWTGLDLLKQDATTKWDEIKLAFATAWAYLGIRLAIFFTLFKAKFREKLREIKDIWAEKWQEFKDKVDTKLTEVQTSISTNIEAALTYLTGLKSRFATVGSDFVQGIIDGIASMASALAQAVSALVDGIFGQAQDEAEENSPSKRAIRDIGIPIAQGIAVGMAKGRPLVSGSLSGLLNAAIQPVMSPGQIATSNSYQYNDTTQYSLNVNSNRQSDNIARDFAIMQAMAGG